MRITSNMMSRNLLQSLELAQGKMSDLELMMSSGHKISKPSDNPSGVNSALGYKTNLAMITQLQNNANDASSFMSTTDATLGNVASIVQRARELAVQGANDTNTPDSRAALATEVDQITAQVQTLANTKFGNKYLFNGTKTDTEPAPNGPALAFATPYNPIQLDVGNNTKVDVSADGPKIFLGDSALGIPGLLSNPPGSGNGILDQLSNALKTGTSTDISNTINGIDASLDNISAARAALGANVNRVTAITSQMTTMTTNLTGSLSNVQDTDMAQAIVDFQTQQNTYEAALSVGTKIIQPSLVNFMQ